MFQAFKSSYANLKERFSKAFAKTRSLFSTKVTSLFKSGWDESALESLEQVLYEADLGSLLAGEFTEKVRLFLKKNKDASPEEILECMRAYALEILEEPPQIEKTEGNEQIPHTILVVGVNGSGKTTSIAKLATLYHEEGKKVLLAAGDTFRAAAIEQLSTWAGKCKVEIVKSTLGSDPSAVIFDALTAAKSRHYDTLIIDTAGRLQNKTDLMQELKKVRRTCDKAMHGAPHETLLIIDATTGQNGIDQAITFHQFTPLTGIVLTKLDGSAKGGIILSIYKQLGIPIRFIGVGEKAKDLIPFNKENYVQALFKK